MAKLDEVLARIGLDNIKVQYLADSMSNIALKNSETEISFVTKEITPNDAMNGTSKTAMIVWIDSNDYNRAVQEVKSEPSREQQLETALQSVVDLQTANYGDGMDTHMALKTLVDETLIPLLKEGE